MRRSARRERQATGLVRERVPVRAELYPGYGPRSVTGEERSAIEELQLSVVDRAERLAQ